jgi:membrane-bound lytic murein transglycosylase D
LGEDFDALEWEITAVNKKITNMNKRKDTLLLPVKKVEIPLPKTGDITSQKKTDITAEKKKAPAVKAEARYHKVLPGETLYRISLRYKVSVKELRRLNKLAPNEPIYTSQKLLVSSPGTK